MAGAVRTGRKQWNLQDAAMHKFRMQLAEDGCVESQLVLAKQLLLEDCSDINAVREANKRQGLCWLVRAAEQGNDEASVLLRQCFEEGRGITSENYKEIKACLDMTPGEKIARKAARDLFASLSNGEEFITSEQLEMRMREIYKLQKEKKNINDKSAIKSPRKIHYRNGNASLHDDNHDIHEQQNITEANLIAAAVTYTNGRLPVVSRALCLSTPPVGSLDHVPFFSRFLLHPWMTLQLVYHKILRLANLSFTEFGNINLLVLLVLYSLLNTENITLFVPMGLYYFSFIIMVISTVRMLHTQREFVDFRIWSGLFLRHSDGNLNSEEPEFQFIRNKLQPYVHFFVALLTNLILHPIVAVQWIPQSEFTVLAFSLTFLTLVVFMKSNSHCSYPDMLTLFSFCINFLAKYPYENDAVVNQGWRFLELNIPTFPSYIVGNGIEFCLNFRVIFYLLIPGILIIMAQKNNWHGIYKFLIPHCVTLSWLQIFIISSQGATMFGLARATLMLVGFVLFLPLVGLATVFLPVVAAVEWLSLTDIIWRASVALTLFIITLVMSCFLAPNKRVGKYITSLQVILSIIALVFLVMPYVQEVNNPANPLLQTHDEIQTSIYEPMEKMLDLTKSNPKEELLSWDVYQQVCHQPAWEKMNKVTTQISCANLEGIHVKWEGIIYDLEIKSARNIWTEAISGLPTTINEFLKCLLGTNNILECHGDPECFVVKNLIKKQSKCNLNSWNRYEYKISIRMETGLLSKGAEVFLSASHEFSNFTKKLKLGDKIWFQGELANDRNLRLGSIEPLVKLYEIGCMGCHNLELTDYKLKYSERIHMSDIINDLYIGCKSVLNFVFNPLLIFK